MINRAVVRGGKPYPPAKVEEVEVLPGVAGALDRLRRAGFLLIVVTNQPDVARGTQRRDVVDAIHAHLGRVLPIDEFRVCPHDDADACACRKPQPGLLLQTARDGRIDLSRSYMVGDRWRDIEAGRRAGCRTILIDYDYNELRPRDPDATVRSLEEAADWILSPTSSGGAS